MPDYEKAFDTVCQKTLQKKLEHYSIKSASHDLSNCIYQTIYQTQNNSFLLKNKNQIWR